MRGVAFRVVLSVGGLGMRFVDLDWTVSGISTWDVQDVI